MNKQIIPIAVFAILITAILTAQTAMAHDGPDPEPVVQHTMDTVLGLTPIQITILITGIGIGGRTLIAVGKHPKSFSLAVMAQSVFIGFLSSISLVSASVGNLPVGINDLTLFSILIGQIIIVAGIDKGVRDAQKALAPSIKSRTPVPSPVHTHDTNTYAPPPQPQGNTYDVQVAQELAEMQSIIDDEESEDLPPGKGA